MSDSPNPLTDKYFFVHNHVGFPILATGQIEGCVAPGWFLVSVWGAEGPKFNNVSRVMSLEKMSDWKFFPTAGEATQYKEAYKTKLRG